MVGPHSLEIAVHVAELADAAWTAHERHREHVAFENDLKIVHVEVEETLEKELEKERRHNRKLRAAIQVYENALQKELERQASAEWLHSSRETSPDETIGTSWNGQSVTPMRVHSNKMTMLYDELTKKLKLGTFLEKLKKPPPNADGISPTEMKSEEDICIPDHLDDPNGWLWVTDYDTFGSDMSEEDDLGSDGYILVDKEDFVDGIASFLARYITSMPQAKNMSPEQLQKTLLKAFTGAENKGKLRKLWETGRLMYTATTWGGTVFGIYRHPVVLRAASIALWTTCSLFLAVLT